MEKAAVRIGEGSERATRKTAERARKRRSASVWASLCVARWVEIVERARYGADSNVAERERGRMRA